MRIETARLVIRTLEPRDADSWIAMVNDPEVQRFLPPSAPVTLETFQGALEQRHTLEHERGYATWAVDAKETGTFIGQSGFFPAEGKGPEVEIRYHFDKASWNKGYATEALIAVLAYGFGPAGLDRAMAVVIPQNTASCRVLEKAGMRFEGIATYYDIPGLRKYGAERAWWSAPPQVRP